MDQVEYQESLLRALGYTTAAELKQLQQERATRIARKRNRIIECLEPFSRREILEKVRRMLEDCDKTYDRLLTQNTLLVNELAELKYRAIKLNPTPFAVHMLRCQILGREVERAQNDLLEVDETIEYLDPDEQSSRKAR